MKKNLLPILLLMVLVFSLVGCGNNLVLESQNQVFITRMIDKLGVIDLVKSKVPAGSKIALVSLEEGQNNSLSNFVEDQIIKKLLDSGYAPIMERGKGIIAQVEKEGNKKHLATYDNHMDATDYVVSYRILDCNVSYAKDKQDNIPVKAFIKTHIRIQNSSTGEIVLAKDISGTLDDTSVSSQVSDFNYSYLDDSKKN